MNAAGATHEGQYTTASGAHLAGLREDVLHHDPLLTCLVELTRLLGRPSTRAALAAGLPIAAGRLSASLFARAVARPGLSSRVVRRTLNEIARILLPVILLLKDDEACVLLRWDETDETARLLFPETGQGEVLLPRAQLADRCFGIAILAKPRFDFDARTPEVGNVADRHWFSGVLLEQAALCRDVLTAALLVNVLALVMPFFVMNVYDRVVRNNVVDTLWVLALGVILVIGMGYMLRRLRSRFIDLASARIDVKLSALIRERVLGMRLAAKPASVGSIAANLRSFEAVRRFIVSANVSALIGFPLALIFCW